jgi:hypothetical protein
VLLAELETSLLTDLCRAITAEFPYWDWGELLVLLRALDCLSPWVIGMLSLAAVSIDLFRLPLMTARRKSTGRIVQLAQYALPGHLGRKPGIRSL